MTKITIENQHAINGKTHHFYGHFPYSYVDIEGMSGEIQLLRCSMILAGATVGKVGKGSLCELGCGADKHNNTQAQAYLYMYIDNII